LADNHSAGTFAHTTNTLSMVISIIISTLEKALKWAFLATTGKKWKSIVLSRPLSLSLYSSYSASVENVFKCLRTRTMTADRAANRQVAALFSTLELFCLIYQSCVRMSFKPISTIARSGRGYLSS
jgi:hypothetical protein